MPIKYLKALIVSIIIVAGLSGVYYFQSHNYQAGVKGVSEDLSGKLVITFFDVGQGDAALIRLPDNEDILIDGGPDDTVIRKLGKALPFYDRDLELVILSHPHADHVTGLVEVLRRYEVKKILMTGALHTTSDYLAFLDLIKEKNIPVEIIDSPRVLPLTEKINLDILFPDKSFVGVKVENLNNTSIVAKLIYASTSALFMGDLEIEEKLLDENFDFNADVYKVSHHGSNNGNDLKFLEAVKPAYAVISSGADNFYGHPHYRTLKNLERVGAKILRTDRDGDIRLISDGERFYLIE